MREHPYLVQRVQRREVENTERKGVDRGFSFEYMGSSEFEWGALPASLKVLRAAAIPPAPAEMTSGKHSVWFVGPETLRPLALEFFEDQLSGQPKQRLKEWTNIDEAYGNSKWGHKASECETIGWWCVDEGLPFVLFKNRDDAALWLKLIKS